VSGAAPVGGLDPVPAGQMQMTRCHNGLPTHALKSAGPNADPREMRRLSALAFVAVGGLVVASCGGTAPSARHGPTARPTPSATAPVEAVEWTPVLVSQVQAAQFAVAEQQYAWCFIYGQLDQSLVDDPVSQCSTDGLTSDEVHEIQDLIVQTP